VCANFADAHGSVSLASHLAEAMIDHTLEIAAAVRDATRASMETISRLTAKTIGCSSRTRAPPQWNVEFDAMTFASRDA